MPQAPLKESFGQILARASLWVFRSHLSRKKRQLAVSNRFWEIGSWAIGSWAIKSSLIKVQMRSLGRNFNCLFQSTANSKEMCWLFSEHQNRSLSYHAQDNSFTSTALGIETKILFARNEQKDCSVKPDTGGGLSSAECNAQINGKLLVFKLRSKAISVTLFDIFRRMMSNVG